MLWMLMITTFAPVAEAGPGDGRVLNAVERADNVRDQRDDRSDLRSLVQTIEMWNAAMVRQDSRAALAADARLFTWLDREIAESEREVAEARREPRRSSRELRGSRRETRYAPGPTDRYDRGDDRRDRRDARVDQAQARFDVARTRQIRDELRALQPDFERGRASARDVRQKRALLAELTSMARRELGEGREEMHEDRVETREDRRERAEHDLRW